MGAVYRWTKMNNRQKQAKNVKFKKISNTFIPSDLKGKKILAFS